MRFCLSDDWKFHKIFQENIRTKESYFCQNANKISLGNWHRNCLLKKLSSVGHVLSCHRTIVDKNIITEFERHILTLFWPIFPFYIPLILSWRRPLSYRNQSIDLLCKSMDWFLYDNALHHERVKTPQKQKVSDDFRGYKMVTLTRNGLRIKLYFCLKF